MSGEGDWVKVDRGEPDGRAMARVVERIRKLLNVEGRTEAEAEQFAGEAQRLMTKYNLDMAQVAASGGGAEAGQERVKEKQDPGRASFKWQRELAAACAGAHFVYHFVAEGREHRGSDESGPDETPAKKRMRELRGWGLSLREIATRLEAEGLEAPRGGRRWASSSVQKILDERRLSKTSAHTFVGRRVNVVAARMTFDYLCQAAQRLCPFAGYTNSGYSWKAGFSDRLQARLYDRKRALLAEHEAAQRAAREAHQRKVDEVKRRRQEAFERQQELRRLHPRPPTAAETVAATAAGARVAATQAPSCSDHWHCDPEVAGHDCSAPDRARPCPACGVDRPPAAEDDGWSPGDGAEDAAGVDVSDIDGLDLEEPTALVLASQYDRDEMERNYEAAHGFEPGYFARLRAEGEARRRDEAERRERGELPETAAKPETEAQRRRREERERRAQERAQRRQEVARHREWAHRDKDAYWAGERAAREVGLDPQVAAAAERPKLGGRR